MNKKVVSSLLRHRYKRSKWSKFKEYVTDMYYDIESYFTQKKEAIEKFFYWGWKLRRNHDWDYGFVEDMLLLKLKRLQKGVYEKGHHIYKKKSREYRALQEAIHILETKDKIETQFWKKDIMHGSYRVCADDDFTKILTTHQYTLDRGKIEKEEALEKERRKRFYVILEKWGEKWWD